MYATLEEAYETPSFTRHAQKKRRPKVAQQFTESSTNDYVMAGREEFTGAGELDTEGDRKKGSNYLSTAPKDAYMGKLNDYTFGCKQYGVCPKPLTQSQREGFANPPLTKLANKCAPLAATNYEYPMSEADKRKFKNAMNAALREDYEAPAPIVQKSSRMVDMNKVDGFGDDDLDQYLSLDDMKDQITLEPIKTQTKKASTATPYDPASSPFAELLREAANRRRQQGVVWDLPAQAAQAAHESARPPMWMDLLLFVSIGVLVILIMDQLFRLAMMMGMQQTLEILRPFIEEANRNLKEA